MSSVVRGMNVENSIQKEAYGLLINRHPSLCQQKRHHSMSSLPMFVLSALEDLVSISFLIVDNISLVMISFSKPSARPKTFWFIWLQEPWSYAWGHTSQLERLRDTTLSETMRLRTTTCLWRKIGKSRRTLYLDVDHVKKDNLLMSSVNVENRIHARRHMEPSSTDTCPYPWRSRFNLASQCLPTFQVRWSRFPTLAHGPKTSDSYDCKNLEIMLGGMLPSGNGFPIRLPTSWSDLEPPLVCD